MLDRGAGERADLIGHIENAGDAFGVTVLVAPHDLIEQIAVVLAVLFPVAPQRRTDTRHLVVGQRRALHERDLVEHALHERLDASRVARPRDAHAELRPGILLRQRFDLDAVGATELLPDRVEQPPLQHHGHGPQREQVRVVVGERPRKHDRHLTLRRDALLDGLLHDAGRRRDAEIAPRFTSLGRRQARDVGLDKWLHHVRREAADEDEGEVAGVGEPRLVERQRFRQVPLINGRGCFRLTPPVIAAERGIQCLAEHDIRTGHLIREQALALLDQCGKRRRIPAGRGESQIQQLEHRLQILRRASTGESFADLAEVRHHGDRFAREHAVQRGVVEAAHPSHTNHVIRGTRRDEVGIARQRCAAWCGGSKQNLILFQRGRLQDDGGPVRERPLRDATRTRHRLDDGAGLRLRVHQRLAGVHVHVGIDATTRRGLHRRGELRLSRQRQADRFRCGHNHQTVLFGKPLRSECIDFLERNHRKEAAVEGQFLPNRWQCFVLEEVACVLVGAAL